MHQPRPHFVLPFVFSVLALGACENLPPLSELGLDGAQTGALSQDTIAAGLREALIVGSRRAVGELGEPGGFLESSFRVPLPPSLEQAKEVGARFGLGGLFEDMEQRLNRAAEAAAPHALALFEDAIRQLTFADVMEIYRGGDDAATRYLERTTGDALERALRGEISGRLAAVGAVDTYERLADSYNQLPFVTPVEADVTAWVTGHAREALFTQLAREEAAIREDPVQRTTALLRRVFGPSGGGR